jgi:hypothetical protein
MDKKPRLGSDPVEWIRDTRKVGIRWFVSEDNVKEFFNNLEAKWGETYQEKGAWVVSVKKG